MCWHICFRLKCLKGKLRCQRIQANSRLEFLTCLESDAFVSGSFCKFNSVCTRNQGPDDLSDMGDKTLSRSYNWGFFKARGFSLRNQLSIPASPKCTEAVIPTTEAWGRWSYSCQVTLEGVIIAVQSWARPAATPSVLSQRVTSPVRSRLPKVNLLCEVTQPLASNPTIITYKNLPLKRQSEFNRVTPCRVSFCGRGRRVEKAVCAYERLHLQMLMLKIVPLPEYGAK
jgi:hypothetical protein